MQRADYMTTTMDRADRKRFGHLGAFRCGRGFTLTELMVSTAIGSLVLTGVLSAFLFFCRTGVRLGYYNDMEAQTRMLYQRFGQDARQASGVNWGSADSLTLTVDGTNVTYAYDSAKKQFTRTVGGVSNVLVRGVNSFKFVAYSLDGAPLSLGGSLTSVAGATKMVQVDMDLSRNTASAVNATAQSVSACYVLRNKSTT